MSIAYSNDNRYNRAYLGLGDQEAQSISVTADPTSASLAVFFASKS